MRQLARLVSERFRRFCNVLQSCSELFNDQFCTPEPKRCQIGSQKDPASVAENIDHKSKQTVI